MNALDLLYTVKAIIILGWLEFFGSLFHYVGMSRKEDYAKEVGLALRWYFRLRSEELFLLT